MPRDYAASCALFTCLLLAACGDDGGSTDTETGTSTDTGAEVSSFELRTVSGGTVDVLGMNFVQCWGDPNEGYTKVVVQFDADAMTMIESQHDDPLCANQAVDAASFMLEGGPAGDQDITSWEAGYLPAHLDLPLVGTRIDMLRTGEDGQKVPTKTTLLVDDGVTPPRIYTGYLEGPIDDDGFPTAMYNDFLSDLDEPIWGTWVATVDAEVRDLDGGTWTRCVTGDAPPSWVFERWQFDNDRLTLQRFDQGADMTCASAEAGAVLEDGIAVVTVTNDVEDVSWPGGTLTATELRLANDTTGVLSTRLVVLDEAGGMQLYLSADGQGFEPTKMLEPTPLTPE